LGATSFRAATQGRLGGCLVSRVAAEDQDRLAARLVDAEVRAHEPDLLALEGVIDLVADGKHLLAGRHDPYDEAGPQSPPRGRIR
jgi:hypothetical protein